MSPGYGGGNFGVGPAVGAGPTIAPTGPPTGHHSGFAPSIEPGLGSVMIYNTLVMHDGYTATGRRNVDKFRVNRIDGIGGLPEIRDAREVRPAAHGEVVFDSYYGGRNITIEGVIEAGNIAMLRRMIQEMKYAFGDPTSYDLKFVGNPGYGFADSYIKCKPTGLSIEETQSGQGFKREFQVTLRAANPFLRSVTMITSVTTFNGSLPVQNDGNFKANPIFTVRGAVGNPLITHVATGQFIKINGTVTNGKQLIISTAERTIVDELGVNRFAWLDPTSSWFELKPGANTISFTGATLANTRTLTIDFQHTWV